MRGKYGYVDADNKVQYFHFKLAISSISMRPIINSFFLVIVKIWVILHFTFYYKVRVVEYGANKFGFQPSGEGITVAPPTLIDETTDKNGQTIPDYEDEQPQQQQEPQKPYVKNFYCINIQI